MHTLIVSLLCIVLVFISYYDFRYNALPVYLIITAIGLSFLLSVSSNGFVKLLLLGGQNLLLLSIQLIMTTLYFSIRRRKFVNLTLSLLGTGDLIFFLVLMFCFSPVNLIVFLIVSGFLTIIGFIRKRSDYLIPLAGCQAILLCLLLLSTLVTDVIRPYDDSTLARNILLSFYQ